MVLFFLRFFFPPCRASLTSCCLRDMGVASCLPWNAPARPSTSSCSSSAGLGAALGAGTRSRLPRLLRTPPTMPTAYVQRCCMEVSYRCVLCMHLVVGQKLGAQPQALWPGIQHLLIRWAFILQQLLYVVYAQQPCCLCRVDP